MMLVKHWRILSNLFFTSLFNLVSIALTVINACSGCPFDLRVGWINQGTFGGALTSYCSGHSGCSMLLSYSISQSTSAAQSSLLSVGLSTSLFQWSRSSVSEMLSGTLSSSLSIGWRLSLRIRLTFNIEVGSPGRSFADKGGGGKGDLSDNLNATAPSCWKGDYDGLMISSVSEMYPKVVISLFWAWHFFWVAGRFRLPCHISRKLWTLAILCNFLSSASVFISELFSVFVVWNSGSVAANIPLLARANCLTTTFLQRVSPVVIGWLQSITSWLREKLVSTPTPCGMIETILRATLKRSAYFVCVSTCWRHQSVTSGNQNVLLISTGLEW